MREFTGWNPADEERDFEIFSKECRGSILRWEDVERQITFEAQNPITKSIDDIVAELYAAGKSSYSQFGKPRQETNDCCSFGKTHSVDSTQVFQAYKGIETEVYKTFQPWIYGVGKCMNGQHSDSGMSISLAAKWVAQHGVLPADLPGLPKYSGDLQKQLLRNGKEFFEKWKGQAVMYDIEVVPIPMNLEAWQLWVKSGRSINYGTGQRIRLVNGRWEASGSWAHAMCVSPPYYPASGGITNINSHGDGWGEMRADVAKAVIAKGSRYGSAYGIFRFTRRNSKPDYAGF